MSEPEPVWCVCNGYCGFWHATKTGQKWNDVRAVVRTACERTEMPMKQEKRIPNCYECRDVVATRRRRQRGDEWRRYAKAIVEANKKQGKLFET